MATHRQGRSRTQRDCEDNQPTNDHAKFMAAMTNLANSMQANATATIHVVERIGRPAGTGNGEGTGTILDGVSMALTTFMKVNPPIFKGTTNSAEADN
ncbi:hypothetical protein AHAS_Ahas13G0375600 [Arachis hypogaea]